ncbi:MAG: hypothetical protein WDA09_10385 [Bacteriovoracaceae bacterium]
MCRSTGEANIEIYEDPTITDNGTEQTPVNRNRKSTNTAGLDVFLTPTASDNGNLLMQEHFGAGQFGGGEVRGANEFVLKDTKKYLIVVTSEAASNDVTVVLDWYESQ